MPISLLLCLVVLVPLMTACWEDEESSDSGSSSGSNSSMNDGSGGAGGGAGVGPGIAVSGAKANDILAIAEKYYKFHSKAITSQLTGELARDVGQVRFDGTAKDDERASTLCTVAAFVACVEGDGDYAVAGTAAAVGWTSGSAYTANALAAMLERAKFIKDKNRLADAKTLVEYAISLDGQTALYYITLAQVRCALGDEDGALAALEAALALEPDNHAALMFKLQLLVKRGGAAMGQARAVGEKIKENDGKLSKRLTKQEDDCKGMKQVTKDDSKEEVLRKLHDIYSLKVVTPADMVGDLYPGVAGKLLEQILNVSEKDQITFPKFPSDLFNNSKQINVDAKDAVKKYKEWVMGLPPTIWDNSRVKKDREAFPPFCRACSEKPGLHCTMTAADYMRQYNRDVVMNGLKAFEAYARKVEIEAGNELLQASALLEQRRNEAREIYDQEREEAKKLPTEAAQKAAELAAEFKYKRACNQATDKFAHVILTWGPKWYNDVTREGKTCYEKLLPFARCSDMPNHLVFYSRSVIVSQVVGPLVYTTLSCVGYEYYDDADLAAVEAAMEAANKLCNQKFECTADSLSGVVMSVSIGPFELKLGPNMVEFEYVNGVAARVSYDWKKHQMEIGLGVGGKLGALGTGVEAKVYTNFVFQTRKGKLSTAELTDVYVSAEGKISLGGKVTAMEAGGQARMSLMGKGVQLTPSAKVTVAHASVEHAKDLIPKYD